MATKKKPKLSKKAFDMVMDVTHKSIAVGEGRRKGIGIEQRLDREDAMGDSQRAIEAYILKLEQSLKKMRAQLATQRSLVYNSNYIPTRSQ